MGVMDGLWGPAEKLGADTSPPLGFEDSFSPQSNHLEETLHSPDNETYVPLQDSRQYLAGLESKLANVQGRTASARKTESRRLLDALAASRSTHTAQLMRNTEPPCGSLPANDTAPLSSTIDPQGALGAMLRRVAPDRVALTHEEVCQLLQADLLAQMHEAELEAALESQEAAGGVSLASDSSNRQEAAPTNLSDTADPREPSSDEGEK